MEDSTVYVKKYGQSDSCGGIPGVNEKEVWRYSGYKGIPKDEEGELVKTLSEVIKDTLPVLSYQVCYSRFQIAWSAEMLVLPFLSESADLAKCLRGSSEIIIFAATIGLEIDRKIERVKRISPVKALLLQALGAERIEELCNKFCQDIRNEAKEKNLLTTPRFSPGYGDLPLEVQRDFFNLLNCSRKIGLTLNESLLMSPSKSVTAVFGLYSA